MMTCLLKRAVPFIITLIIGSGLGSIFSFQSPSSKTVISRGDGIVNQFVDHLTDSHSKTELEIFFQPTRRFTREALENETTGVVTLLVRFNVDGTTTVLKRLHTLPDGLTEDAERVAGQTSFTPATVDGRPIVATFI